MVEEEQHRKPVRSIIRVIESRSQANRSSAGEEPEEEPQEGTGASPPPI